MSVIKGTVQERTEYAKKIGWFVGKVLAINPTKEELNVMLGIEDKDDDKEIEYLKVDEEGRDRAIVTVWLEDLKTGWKQPVRFTLTNKDVISQTSGKTQYINSVGDTNYAHAEEELDEWFKVFTDFKTKAVLGDKSWRKAVAGEENLYKFIRSWTSINPFKPDAELIFSTKKLFAGDFSELQEIMGSEFDKDVIASGTIRNVEKQIEGTEEKEMVQYQSIFTRAFLPASWAKTLRLGSSKPSSLLTKWKEAFLGDKDGQYGCKDIYSMDELHDFDPAEHLVSTDEVLQDAEDTNYD